MYIYIYTLFTPPFFVLSGFQASRALISKVNEMKTYISASHFTATAAATLAAAPTAAPTRKTPPGQENTMARKDGKAPKLRPKTP